MPDDVEFSPSSRRLVGMPLGELIAAARNPKEHDLPGIRAAISKFGFLDVVILDDRTGRLVAGHGRVESLTQAKRAGDDPPDGIDVRASDGEWLVPTLRGWSSRSDDDAEAYLIASNKLTENGGWDVRELLEVLEDLAEAQLLDVTGYDASEMDGLRQMIEDEAAAAANDDRPDKGEALQLAGVTVGEPDYEVHDGEVWQVGQHLLVVADLHQGWPSWVPLLLPGDLLWPYPTLLAPFTDQAQENRVVMVQPNHYLAGWVLTKWHRISEQAPVLLTEATLVDVQDAASAAAVVG
jgi:hypothetical protein